MRVLMRRMSDAQMFSNELVFCRRVYGQCWSRGWWLVAWLWCDVTC